MTAAPADAYPGMPRWVKIAGIVVLVLVVVVVALVALGIGGDHGPRQHVGGGT